MSGIQRFGHFLTICSPFCSHVKNKRLGCEKSLFARKVIITLGRVSILGTFGRPRSERTRINCHVEHQTRNINEYFYARPADTKNNKRVKIRNSSILFLKKQKPDENDPLEFNENIYIS